MPIKGLNSKGNILGRGGGNLPLAVKYNPVLYLSSTYGKFDTSQSGSDTFINKWTDPYNKLSAEQTTGSYRPKLVDSDGRLRPNFDGTDDYLVTNNNLGISGTEKYTANIWIKCSNNSDAQDIVSFGNGSKSELSLRIEGGGTNNVRLAFNGDALTFNVPFNDGNWHNFLIEQTSDGDVADYNVHFDNFPISTTVVIGSTINITDNPLYIGIYIDKSQRWYDGLNDEISFYKGLLTSSQKTNLYNEGKKLLNL